MIELGENPVKSCSLGRTYGHQNEVAELSGVVLPRLSTSEFHTVSSCGQFNGASISRILLNVYNLAPKAPSKDIMGMLTIKGHIHTRAFMVMFVLVKPTPIINGSSIYLQRLLYVLSTGGCLMDAEKGRHLFDVSALKLRSTLVIPYTWEQILDLLGSLGASSLWLGHELETWSGHTSPVLALNDVGVLWLAKLIENSANKVFGILTVRNHVADDHGDVDVLAGVPAIVVGGHADHLVSHLGLAGELGLWKCGHVDDGSTPGAVHVRLSAGRELRSLCI